MKLRTGFVSNSSSSSFIAVVRRVEEVSDLTPEAVSTKKYIGLGVGLTEGVDLIEIDANILQALSLFEDYECLDRENIPVYEVIASSTEFEGFRFHIGVANDYEVVAEYTDYNSTETIETFTERYLNEVQLAYYQKMCTPKKKKTKKK